MVLVWGGKIVALRQAVGASLQVLDAKAIGKGESQGHPPNLVNVSRWTRAQQAQAGGRGAARPVTLTPAPSQGTSTCQ